MMKKKDVKSDTNVFKSVVDNTAELKDGYCRGLQALKGNSLKVSVSKQQNLLGSVDIDDCTKGLYPNASRWDYAIGYDQKAWFVEVHPANTSNVKEMLKKVEWLESWLKDKGSQLAEIRRDHLHYWIPSGKVCISKTSPQYRSLAKHNLQITSSPFVLK